MSSLYDDREWERQAHELARQQYGGDAQIDRQQFAHGAFLARRAAELDGFAEAVEERANAVLNREHDVTRREQWCARHEKHRDAWSRMMAALFAVSLMCLACSALIIWTLTRN